MKPMMSEREITIISLLLEPWYDVFEWGSGGSTVFFSSLVKSWVSYEHDPEWIKKVQKEMVGNTRVVLVKEKKHYINPEGRYDFILIDGLHRKECLHKAMTMLKPGGSILLHDSERLEYKDWVNDFPNLCLVKGEIPEDKTHYKHRGLRLYENDS